jgi:pyruvate carboxylase subunit B
MPGKIIRVLAKAGDEVQKDQPLLVMEAMKMENELRSPSSGRVEAIRAQPGSAVEKGTVLVELSATG